MEVTMLAKNPFKIGNWVEYRPSILNGVMLSGEPFDPRFIPGEKYRVVAVQKGNYLLCEGFEKMPGGGIHYSQFVPLPPKNPFKVGDWVEYRPSIRGRMILQSAPFEPKMVKGHKYRVVAIQKENYLLCQGFEKMPGGGIAWHEFVPVEESEEDIIK